VPVNLSMIVRTPFAVYCVILPAGA